MQSVTIEVKNNRIINIIGAGLAGCECALYLAKNGVAVRLYDMKPKQFSPAHRDVNFGELVCSNSLKSEELSSASGLLKSELKMLGCSLLDIAQKCRVPSGGALAVNREDFAKEITEQIKSQPNIEIISEKVYEIDSDNITVIATGPLTDKDLLQSLNDIIGEKNSYFYDAMAPIVSADSLDYKKCFWGNRYDKGGEEGHYLNCPMTKEEYSVFWNDLINAQCVELKEFENVKVFEGCMPVEIMAKRGEDSLRYGPLKPVGLRNPNSEVRPYAVVQLRKENSEGTMLNLVGFQTNLLFGEQKRVFSLIPALKNAEFLKYGVMHRNTYVNAPKVLNCFLQTKSSPNIFIAGQLSGVEGYVESIGTGLFVGINIKRLIDGKDLISLPSNTCLGGIINYIINYDGKDFQPMNANFGVLPQPSERIKDKKLKKQTISELALNEMKKFVGGI